MKYPSNQNASLFNNVSSFILFFYFIFSKSEIYATRAHFFVYAGKQWVKCLKVFILMSEIFRELPNTIELLYDYLS